MMLFTYLQWKQINTVKKSTLSIGSYTGHCISMILQLVESHFFRTFNIIHHVPPQFTIIHHNQQQIIMTLQVLPWFTTLQHDAPWSTTINHDTPRSTEFLHDLQCTRSHLYNSENQCIHFKKWSPTWFSSKFWKYYFIQNNKDLWKTCKLMSLRYKFE